jgi:hypothetical protein
MNHENKLCPRCQLSFVCNIGDVVNCQCNISLDDDTKLFLSKTHYDCLCASCLQHYNQLVLLSRKYQVPKQKEIMLEGVHYYIENGNWVFTELYHLLRGYCCGSGCRHCVYGFKSKIK